MSDLRHRDPKVELPEPGSGDVTAYMILDTPKTTRVKSSTVREHPDWFLWWRPIAASNGDASR